MCLQIIVGTIKGNIQREDADDAEETFHIDSAMPTLLSHMKRVPAEVDPFITMDRELCLEDYEISDKGVGSPQLGPEPGETMDIDQEPVSSNIGQPAPLPTDANEVQPELDDDQFQPPEAPVNSPGGKSSSPSSPSSPLTSIADSVIVDPRSGPLTATTAHSRALPHIPLPRRNVRPNAEDKREESKSITSSNLAERLQGSLAQTGEYRLLGHSPLKADYRLLATAGYRLQGYPAQMAKNRLLGPSPQMGDYRLLGPSVQTVVFDTDQSAHS